MLNLKVQFFTFFFPEEMGCAPTFPLSNAVQAQPVEGRTKQEGLCNNAQPLVKRFSESFSQRIIFPSPENLLLRLLVHHIVSNRCCDEYRRVGTDNHTHQQREDETTNGLTAKNEDGKQR